MNLYPPDSRFAAHEVVDFPNFISYDPAALKYDDLFVPIGVIPDTGSTFATWRPAHHGNLLVDLDAESGPETIRACAAALAAAGWKVTIIDPEHHCFTRSDTKHVYKTIWDIEKAAQYLREHKMAARGSAARRLGVLRDTQLKRPEVIIAPDWQQVYHAFAGSHEYDPASVRDLSTAMENLAKADHRRFHLVLGCGHDTYPYCPSRILDDLVEVDGVVVPNVHRRAYRPLTGTNNLHLGRRLHGGMDAEYPQRHGKTFHIAPLMGEGHSAYDFA